MLFDFSDVGVALWIQHDGPGAILYLQARINGNVAHLNEWGYFFREGGVAFKEPFNLVEQLCGSDVLIGLRSRSSGVRIPADPPP